jgi:AcrR family transcriptional regulator
MSDTKRSRLPQQKRSIEKRERILESAYSLICSRGYNNTSTPEVAKEAGVSVGTVYAYFEDKHDLLMAVVDRYMRTFDAERDEAMASLRTSKDSLRDTLRHFIDRLVVVHEESKAFNLEQKALYYMDPAITALTDAQDRKIRNAITDFLRENQRKYRIDDPVANAFLYNRIIQTTVEKIVFDPGDIERESLVNAALDILCGRLRTNGRSKTMVGEVS